MVQLHTTVVTSKWFSDYQVKGTQNTAWNIYFNEWFLHQSSARITVQTKYFCCTEYNTHITFRHWFFISCKVTQVGIGKGGEGRDYRLELFVISSSSSSHIYLYNSIWHWVLWYYIEGDTQEEATWGSGGSEAGVSLRSVHMANSELCSLKLLHLKVILYSLKYYYWFDSKGL